MADNAITVRARKLMRNPLLNRRQMIVEAIHPGRAGVAKTELREKLSKLMKVKDEKQTVVFGLKTEYGGMKTVGFANIYDTVEDAKKFEHKHRLVRMEVIEKKEKKGRKGIKESKNRGKKIFGTVKKHQLRKSKRQKND